jgi:hypothetical protein
MNNKGIILGYGEMVSFVKQYDIAWQEVDKRIHSIYGKNILQIFGKDTQILEYALLDMIVNLDPDRLEVFSEYAKHEIAKMYVKARTANTWVEEEEQDELKRLYKTYKYSILLITILDIEAFYVRLMLDLITYILSWKTYI